MEEEVNQQSQEVETSAGTRPEVFRYDDYRKFLKDWLSYLRANPPSQSLRKLAEKADLASGYLPSVLSGSRHLSHKAWSKLQPHLGLSQSERSYFELLLILGSADSQNSKVDALERMKRFSAFQRLNPNELEVSEYLTHWYYVAIREMSALPDFKSDPGWIQSRLQYGVSLQEVKSALEFLTRHKFIELGADGSVRHPEKKLECLGSVYRVSLAQFHREMLSLAAQSIERTPSPERLLLGHTVAIEAGQFEAAQAILKEALSKISALPSGDSQAEKAVYQFEISMFPLTRSKEK